MSLKDNNARFFEESLYHSFESLGSTKIRTLAWNTPYILFGKKGINPANPGDTVVETVGVDQYGYTNLF